jgi:fermentation-respiration switch protein FrsA (DUF1100 family)
LPVTIDVKQFAKTVLTNDSFRWRVARVILLTAATSIVLIMAFEDKFIYFPSKYPDGFWNVADLREREGEVFPHIEDCYFKTSDGVRLHGWFCVPHRKTRDGSIPVESEMVLLWFHGNAGNISYRYDMIRAMMKLPVRVFIIDYRGYGRSEGTPSERGLYLDARAAWDYLVNERGISPERVIIFGKSLGSAPAVDLAAQVEPAGLIVQSGFTSAREMAAAVLPFFPRALLQTKMDSIAKISRVRCRKLFIHSRADEVVPFKLGYRLYQAAPEPKQFYEVEGAPHNSTYVVGGARYLDALRKFIESCHPR